jgi:hypothetical protein
MTSGTVWSTASSPCWAACATDRGGVFDHPAYAIKLEAVAVRVAARGEASVPLDVDIVVDRDVVRGFSRRAW